MIDEFNERVSIRLSLQVALLGEIFPSFRAICVDWTEKNIDLIFIVEKALDDEEMEATWRIDTELLSSLPAEYVVNTQVKIVELGQPIPRTGLTVYQRYEGWD